MENIHLTKELLQKYSRKQFLPRCILKVDLQKAFDLMHWNFLQDVLNGMGFLGNSLLGLWLVWPHPHTELSSTTICLGTSNEQGSCGRVIHYHPIFWGSVWKCFKGHSGMLQCNKAFISIIGMLLHGLPISSMWTISY